MRLATEKGKEYALKALAKRREANAKKKDIDNASLPAGSPMYYRCLACGATITVAEGWLTKPDLCHECRALKRLGWLE